MERLPLLVIILLVALPVLSYAVVITGFRVPPGTFAITGGITFTAAGDFGAGAGGDTGLVLAGMDDGANFALAAGDLSYAQSGAEPLDNLTPSPWCNYVKGLIPGAGSTFPFQLGMGNHEQDDAESRIANIKVCLPNLMTNAVAATFPCGTIPYSDGLSGCYAIAYYFDYPASSPIARFIITYHTTTSTMQGIVANYVVGSAPYNWVSGVIDNAKTLGLWTIIVTHKPYFSTGGSGNSGGDMHKLFATKKVDLVISGHDHNYQRSKQLVCGSFSTFDAACVVDDGLDNAYAKGAGTVFVVVGTGGNGLVTVGQNTIQTNYFVTWDQNSYGFLRVNMDGAGLQADFVRVAQLSGTYSDTFTIGTFAPPPPVLTGDFTWTPLSPAVGQQITFTGTATGGTAPYGFQWNFGDGTTSVGQTEVHGYAVAGTYTVTLTVTDSTAQSGLAQHTVTVSSAPSPLIIDFTWLPQSPFTGDPITFTASVSGGTSPYQVSWAFGDASTGSGTTTTKIYSTAGTFTVTATVTDAGLSTSQASKAVTVAQSVPLTASFNWSPTSPTAGTLVIFTASASGGTTPYSFAWNFGDGYSAGGSPASHTYATGGQYTVSLTTSDAGAQTTSSQQTIVVAQPPPNTLVTSFAWSPVTPSSGQNTVFTASLSGGTSPYYLSWDFGDGSAVIQGTTSVANHVFLGGGNYQVKLTVSDSAGAQTQTKSVNNTVTVSSAAPPMIPVVPPVLVEALGYSVFAVPLLPALIIGASTAGLVIAVRRKW